MPLLKKKTFGKTPIPEFLRDDEEVFHCVMTNEIFKDYEEFAERTLLCNSMVWTCSLTGKTCLTYSEALQSEKHARKMIEDFPSGLQIPHLYIASLTNRTGFGEMTEEVFSYIKDRYFVGEVVEAFSNKWKEYKVEQVIPSTKEDSRKSTDTCILPATSYKYNLKVLHHKDEEVTETMTFDMNHIRRKRSSFSREKSKLFLRQYVEQDTEDGIFKVKKSAIEMFGMDEIDFSDIFSGPPPDFNKSKKKINGKKVKQETLAKFLSKNNITEIQTKNNTLMEHLRKAQEQKQKDLEEQKQKKIKDKEMLRQKNLEIASKLREWYTLKDDLLLEDQKKLPDPVPVKCKIPDSLLGEALCVMEFVNNFSTLLKTKHYFPHGLTLDIMEKALTEKKVAGSLVDLFLLLIDAIFTFQEEEASNYKFEYEKISNASGIDFNKDLGYTEASQLATLSSSWCKKHQGVPLNSLLFGPATISEIIRLHLLTSGARLVENFGYKNRYFNRGGYVSEDDPALHFRLHHAHILKLLSIHNVVELSLHDKLRLLNCLVDQILTYKQVRDQIEQRDDDLRERKSDLRHMQANEKKRFQEYTNERLKIKRTISDDLKAKSTKDELEKLQLEIDEKLKVMLEDNKQKKEEAEADIGKLNLQIVDKLTYLGYDRAFRRYIRVSSVPGLFIADEDPNTGTCLNEPVVNVPELVNADRDDVLKYLHKISEEMNSSDKENEPKKNNTQTKVKSLTNGVSETMSPVELDMCSGDPSTCTVHSTSKKHVWYFYHDPQSLNQLMGSLNKRGVRESEFQSVLEIGYEKFVNVLKETPTSVLNNDYAVKKELTMFLRKRVAKDENLGYEEDMEVKDVLCSALVDTFLVLEEKLYNGAIGGIDDEYRDDWRLHLKNKNYANMRIEFGKTTELDNSSDSSDSESTKKDYIDPGKYLTDNQADISSDESDAEILLTQSDAEKQNIQYLANILLQLAETVRPKYLYKPLGNMKRAKKPMTTKSIIDQWKTSLINSTSYSQIFVHYGTLNNCIAWRKSILGARCRVCRKGTNPKQLLLCDNCDKGQHIFCMRPKLASIPKGEWYCSNCAEEKKQEKEDLNNHKQNEEEEMDCSNDEEDSTSSLSTDEKPKEPVNCSSCSDMDQGDMVHCSECPAAYHLDCAVPPIRRAPRGKWICSNCKDRNNDSTRDENQRRSNRIRDETRSDVPLHNVALQELLLDVMRHDDAWPFITPVQRREVPDYYDIIEKPMDFGTIKYKLNMGDYKCDDDFMCDVRLVFSNCNTYNNSDDEVYKCGIRLLKYFMKKCHDLNLSTPDDILLEFELENDNGPRSKRIRTE